MKSEQDRAATAQRQLRAKEERAADLELKLGDPKLKPERKAELATQLERARRDVAEFDREDLKVVEPKRTKPTRDSLAGLGLIKAVKALDAMTKEQRADFLGESQELNTAYSIMSDELKKIESTVGDIAKDYAEVGQGGGALQRRKELASQNTSIAARLAVNRSEIEKEITRENILGAGGVKAKIAENTVETLTDKSGANFLERGAISLVSNGTSALTNAGMSETAAAETTVGIGQTLSRVFDAGSPLTRGARAAAGLIRPNEQTSGSLNEVNRLTEEMISSTKANTEAINRQTEVLRSKSDSNQSGPTPNVMRAQAAQTMVGGAP